MTHAKLRAAITALSREPHMARLIKKNKNRPAFTRSADTFESLCKSIIYQQLSGKAAGTIHRRFLELYKGVSHPSPKQVAKTSIEKFRSVGVSQQKASYLIDLAKKFLDGTVDPKHFREMTDEAIRTHLVAVKGIGRWTADMFLMFTLHRPDVLPTGDLGIQKAMKDLFKLRTLPSAEKMEKLAEPWRPYRTVACRYLWDSLDNA
jgi:DNA-3-methyladenine glycosylase II